MLEKRHPVRRSGFALGLSALSILLFAPSVMAQGGPVADAGGPYDGLVGQPVQFDGSGSVGVGAPIASYDWAEDDSDDAWSVPVGLGFQKTFMFGKTPVRIRLEADYYVVRPDSFGPHWGLQLTVTPVIENPFG